ncbi:hypothetical protein [Gulbenkiania mobilis]|uniref:hypothetical protein n=1 Tax=Gulbenkiania mobilis TaxID=397457 RepID=UPI00384B82CC
MNLAVSQMDENTQKNAALVEEAAAAAESLEEQARLLAETVALFRLDRRSSPRSGPASPPAAVRAHPQREAQLPAAVARPPRDDEGEWESF